MTTKHSPLSLLTKQAQAIAASLKAFERGELPPLDPMTKKLHDARNSEGIKIGVVMDDKVIEINIAWAKLKVTGEVALSEMILREMRETRLQ